MRNRYTCISHCNKGSAVWSSCIRETEPFVLCSHFIVVAENWMGQLLGLLRKKQIRFAQICTKGWCSVQRKKNGCKGGPERNLSFCSPFLFFFSPFFVLLLAELGSETACLQAEFLASAASPLQALCSPGCGINHHPHPCWGIKGGWAVKKSPSVSGRSPPCTGERRQLLEVPVSMNFIF